MDIYMYIYAYPSDLRIFGVETGQTTDWGTTPAPFNILRVWLAESKSMMSFLEAALWC